MNVKQVLRIVSCNAFFQLTVQQWFFNLKTSFLTSKVRSSLRKMFVFFFYVGSPSGLPLFRPSKIYISSSHIFNINNIGRWRHSKKVDSNLLLFLESHCCRFQFCHRETVSFFQSIDTTKENEILYKSSPGFKPTTFLILDLSWLDDLDRLTTVGRQEKCLCPLEPARPEKIYLQASQHHVLAYVSSSLSLDRYSNFLFRSFLIVWEPR